MAQNDIKTYKRSDIKPVVMTDAHKKDLHAKELTSNIVKYTLIAVVLLSLIFSMLTLIKVEVNDDKLDALPKDKDGKPYARFAEFDSYDLIGGWNAKATYSYSDGKRVDINENYQYPNVFDYIVGSVPALNQAINFGSGSTIFAAIEPKDDKMLNSAYMAMLSIEVISLVWIAALAVIFVLSFFKKYAPSQTIINTSLIIHFVITFVMWVFTLALSASSKSNFIFSVGVGMWLNLLVAVVAVFFVILNFIYQMKVKNHERAM